MFTGIIEEQGTLVEVLSQGTNLDFWIRASMAGELRPEQSVSHDGICLTVVEQNEESYRVSLVQQTLSLTTAGKWKPGYKINLERALRLGDRLDGHWVQGHVDGKALCIHRENRDGSYVFRFELPAEFAPQIIEKGSVCLNGVSLTAYDLDGAQFSVSIIPYTYEHTNLKGIQQGDAVNLELDIVGKYLSRSLALRERGQGA